MRRGRREHLNRGSRGRGLHVHGLASALVASLFAVVAFSGTASASDLCGATIMEDTALDHDFVCEGAGIAIGADGVTLSLNGHTISGPVVTDASISGIIVNGRMDVSILGPGIFAGVRIVDSSGVEVKDLTSMESREAGIRLEGSSGVRITENTVFGGGHDAFQLRNSHGNVIKENVAEASDPTGCTVNLVSSNNNLVKENSLSNAGTSAVQFARISGMPPSSDNAIEENQIFDSNHGVRAFVGATGNLVSENEIFGNTNGLSFVGPADTPEALGNTYQENEIRANACGIRGSETELEGNTFIDNEFEDNVTDVCTE